MRSICLFSLVCCLFNLMLLESRVDAAIFSGEIQSISADQQQVVIKTSVEKKKVLPSLLRFRLLSTEKMPLSISSKQDSEPLFLLTVLARLLVFQFESLWKPKQNPRWNVPVKK